MQSSSDPYCLVTHFHSSYETGLRAVPGASIIYAAHILIFIPSLISFIWLALKKELATRSPWLAVVGAVSGFLFTSVTLIEHMFRVVWAAPGEYKITDKTPTGMNTTITSVAYMQLAGIFIISYPARAIRTCVLFGRWKCRGGDDTDGSISDDSDGSQMSNTRRRLASEWMFSLIIVIPSIIMWMYGGLIHVYTFTCQDIVVTLRVMTQILIGYASLLIFAILSTIVSWRVSRELTTNIEMIGMILSTIVLMPIWISLIVYEGKSGDLSPIPPVFVFDLLVIVCTLLTLTWPVIKYFRHPNAITNEIQRIVQLDQVGKTLSATISNTVACGELREFIGADNRKFLDSYKDIGSLRTRIQRSSFGDDHQQCNEIHQDEFKEIYSEFIMHLGEYLPGAITDKWCKHVCEKQFDKDDIIEILDETSEIIETKLSELFASFCEANCGKRVNKKVRDPAIKGLKMAIKIEEIHIHVHAPPPRSRQRAQSTAMREITQPATVVEISPADPPPRQLQI